ncbi:hypothetical protein L3Y34_006999 [Caenorhabditis briggsae]|uniref:Tyrosine specific protein phosphatases domain-containing protein n=1 Tax=Caenorhabditis briggsae TaxID=6238 RepID=A0AAE9A0Q1_CAEBR|nr:hypothetical protein L3Y34_006999 [Caenorhabditis briggsae]
MRCNPQGGIVHCSAGIGRSGTIAYVEKLYQEIYYADNGKVAHQLFLFSHYAVIELIVDTVGKSNLNADDKEFVLAVRAAWAEHVAEIEQAKKNAAAKKAEEAAKKGKNSKGKK